MIRENEFNSAWWGKRVGILTDTEFFSLPRGDQAALLGPFDWVEFRASLDAAPPANVLLAAGFFMADTQIGFRIALRRVPAIPDPGALELRFADESPFSVDAEQLRDFRHERYLQLPGITAAKVNDRYARWANILVRESPAWCVQAFHQSRLQGWFLSREAPPGLNLALAMLHRGATISGMILYQGIMRAYVQRGAQIGWASFSAGNVEVANMYARLGSHFTQATGCWLWTPPTNAA